MGGVYVHVPFCVRKCRYCDFVSYPRARFDGQIHSYLQGVIAEAQLRAEEIRHAAPVQSMYIGGGTPTVVAPGDLASFIEALRDAVNPAAVCEFTVETNPAAVDLDGLVALRRAGVNRLSIGFQSLDDSELAALGRAHSAQDCVEVFRSAREAGFDNINIDLMLGIPGQTSASLAATVSRALSLCPEHVSAYCLILEDGTPLARDVAEGAVVLPSDDETADFYEWFVETSGDAGYRRYEISNFCLPGKECAHNIMYWENGDYIGLGVAAHSHLGRGALAHSNSLQYECGDSGADLASAVRWWNGESTQDYLAMLNAGAAPAVGREHRTPMGEASDALMLGLRMARGVDLLALGAEYDLDLVSEFGPRFARLSDRGLLCLDGARACLTARGFLLANIVFRECV
ncbi:MAG: radical SAM family heme chaperone HemW [Clostridia bacterium]|nr:radical SAM family heme chaperone HemW [Clostridia bacterium]